MPPRRVLVLRERISRDDLDRARAEHGWHLVNVVPGGRDRPFQVTFLTADEHEGLQFVDDAQAGEQYVLVHFATGRGERETCASLPVLSDEELERLTVAPSHDGERVRALRCLALHAGPARPRGELVSLFGAALDALSPEVRAAALHGVTALRLGELTDQLRRLAREEPDGALRARARAVLDAAVGGRA